MSAHAPPYEVPRHTPLDFTRRGVTLVPKSLALHTRKVVHRFGLFQLAWPFAVAYWTDSFFLDVWAVIITMNGQFITRASFKRFPWTAVVCCIYPVAFIASATNCDLMSIWNWIPSRFSPVLLLQLASAVWASYSIFCISCCYFSHQRTPSIE